jgi:hypothetical protein
VAAGLVATMAAVAFVGVHRRLANYLYGDYGLAAVLGVGDLSMLAGPVVRELPDDRPVALVGDARAFVYPIPTSRLSYRTVFDVDVDAAGGDVIRAWAGDAGGTERALVIDPNELRRFASTYWKIPPPPPDIAARTEPFVVRESTPGTR